MLEEAANRSRPMRGISGSAACIGPAEAASRAAQSEMPRCVSSRNASRDYSGRNEKRGDDGITKWEARKQAMRSGGGAISG